MGRILVRDTLKRWLDSKIKHDATGPRKWNYADLADALTVSPSLIEKVMSGHANITTRLMMKLCAFTRYDVGELFYYDPNAKPAEDKEDGD